jgi:hypothetical protein
MNALDLADRLSRLENRLQIEDLLTRYAIACDDRDIPELGQCFTSNGTFSTVDSVIAGRPAIEDYFTQRFDTYGPTLHDPHRAYVEFIDDEHAGGTVIARSELLLAGGMFVAAFRYLDRYELDRGRWRFAARVCSFLYSAPLRELIDLDPGQPRRRWPGREPQEADIPEQLQTWKDFYST